MVNKRGISGLQKQAYCGNREAENESRWKSRRPGVGRVTFPIWTSELLRRAFGYSLTARQDLHLLACNHGQFQHALHSLVFTLP